MKPTNLWTFFLSVPLLTPPHGKNINSYLDRRWTDVGLPIGDHDDHLLRIPPRVDQDSFGLQQGVVRGCVPVWRPSRCDRFQPVVEGTLGLGVRLSVQLEVVDFDRGGCAVGDDGHASVVLVDGEVLQYSLENQITNILWRLIELVMLRARKDM